MHQDLQSAAFSENDVVLFAPFGLDYITDVIREEEDQERIFEEDQKRGYRDKSRKGMGKKKLRSTNENNIFKKRKKVPNRKRRKCKKRCKSGRRGRFSPSMLSTIYPASAADGLTIGRLSIR